MLTSAYFLSFAAFQLPLGVLLDRYGPRRVEATLLLFAAAGAFVFARAETLTGLMIGRAGVPGIEGNTYLPGAMGEHLTSASAIALLTLFIRRLIKSPWGRVIKAIREDEALAKI